VILNWNESSVIQSLFLLSLCGFLTNLHNASPLAAGEQRLFAPPSITVVVSETGRVWFVLFMSRRPKQIHFDEIDTVKPLLFESLRIKSWDSDMIMSIWFLTNQSRAALREAGFREAESLNEAFQTLREKSWCCSGYYERIKVFFDLRWMWTCCRRPAEQNQGPSKQHFKILLLSCVESMCIVKNNL